MSRNVRAYAMQVLCPQLNVLYADMLSNSKLVTCWTFLIGQTQIPTSNVNYGSIPSRCSTARTLALCLFTEAKRAMIQFFVVNTYHFAFHYRTKCPH